MAKRLGKYKISTQESALSIADGGTVEGTLKVTGAVTLSNLTSNVHYANAAVGQLYVTASGRLDALGTGSNSGVVLVKMA